MFAWINRLLEWFKSLFWKEEMELTLVGLQVKIIGLILLNMLMFFKRAKFLHYSPCFQYFSTLEKLLLSTLLLPAHLTKI